MGRCCVARSVVLSVVVCGSLLCCAIFSFICSGLWVVVYPFVLFPLVIVLSVLLRCADSDYFLLVSSNLSYISSNVYSTEINENICR